MDITKALLNLAVGGSIEDNRAFQKLKFCPRASAGPAVPGNRFNPEWCA